MRSIIVSAGKRTFSVSIGFNLLFFSFLKLFLFVLHKLILLQYCTHVILDKPNVAEAYKSVRILSDEWGARINYPMKQELVSQTPFKKEQS